MCADNANQPLPRQGLWLPPSSCDENDEQGQIQEEAGLRINGSGCNQVTGDHYDDLGQDSTEATG